MRILHITPTYSPSIGGIEEVVFQLAHHARRVGIEADVAHVAVNLQRGVREDEGFSVHTLPLIGHRMLGWAPSLAELASRYDLLHVHDPQVGALSLNIGGRLSRIPAVLSTHGGFGHTDRAALVKRYHARVTAPWILRRYSRVMASSRTDLEVFGRYYPGTVLVENGVNTRKFSCSSPTVNRDVNRWIYWGRFSNNKRIESLIELVASLRQDGVVVNLTICGRDFDGLLPSLKAQVVQLGLEGLVSFKVGLTESGLREEVSKCGVFVLPSEYEGFGLSILEAMGAGLIPLCRDIPPMNLLAGDSGYFLGFDGGVDDILAVRKLLAPSGDASIDERRARAMHRASLFDWEVRFDSYRTHYEDCIREGVAGRRVSDEA